jgi:hypothetical protein
MQLGANDCSGIRLQSECHRERRVAAIKRTSKAGNGVQSANNTPAEGGCDQETATPSQRRPIMATCNFDVHTAETLMGVAELHWRAANKAAQAARDEYDAARRLYTSARSDYAAAGHHAAAAVGAGQGD